MIEYVTGFLFNQEVTEVLLIQKTKPEWQAGKLNGVGGKLEPGETAMAAMVREFKEETGVQIDPLYWDLFAVISQDHKFNCFFFYSIDHTDEWFNKVETQEEEQLVKIPISQVRATGDSNLIYNLNWLIPLAIQDAFGTSYGTTRFVIQD